MIKYDNIEWAIINNKDHRYWVVFILPDDFNEEWKAILLSSRSDSN